MTSNRSDAYGRVMRTLEDLSASKFHEDYDAAVAYYQKALKADPRNATYKIRLHQARFDAGEFHIKRGLEMQSRRRPVSVRRHAPLCWFSCIADTCWSCRWCRELRADLTVRPDRSGWPRRGSSVSRAADCQSKSARESSGESSPTSCGGVA